MAKKLDRTHGESTNTESEDEGDGDNELGNIPNQMKGKYHPYILYCSSSDRNGLGYLLHFLQYTIVNRLQDSIEGEEDNNNLEDADCADYHVNSTCIPDSNTVPGMDEANKSRDEKDHGPTPRKVCFAWVGSGISFISLARRTLYYTTPSSDLDSDQYSDNIQKS